jgi:hypothetical protein
MTDDQKVYAMFLIRTWERPDLADAAERVEKALFNRSLSHYDALLKMFNERFGA